MSDNVQPGSAATLACAAGHGPDNDRRSSTRLALLIRPAKLICGRFEYPCVMRDVSGEGVSIRLFHPLPTEADYAIEMLGGDRFAIEPVWQEGLAAGFRFAVPVDLDQVLANAGPHPDRPVRLAVDLAATLEQRGARSTVVIDNLSQQGARLRSSDHLALGAMVVLESECLPRIHAKVRWRKAERYGLVFEETFNLAQLAGVAARIYSAQSVGQANCSAA